MKIYINGWQGTWGWIPQFKTFLSKSSDFELCESANEAEIIFQADTTNYKTILKYLGNKKVVTNVLDLADWHTGSPSLDIEEYVLNVCKNANKVFCISNDVRNKLVENYNLDSTVIYYPSQVCIRDVKTVTEQITLLKRKQIVIFCRLGDPGKAIPQAVEAFDRSNLHCSGWRLLLCGPEPPMINKFPKSVAYLSFLDKEELFNLISSSVYALQPSLGEGLGLPSIESSLLGTLPIFRDINSTKEIFEELLCMTKSVNMFCDDEELSSCTFKECVQFFDKNKKDYYNSVLLARAIALPWIREHAFENIRMELLKCN
jgi:hypothetical protein